MNCKEFVSNALEITHVQVAIIFARIAFVYIFLTACAPPPEITNSPIPPVGILYTGRVIDGSNQHLIEEAKVTLDIQGASRIDFTDTEGIYRFELPISTEVNGMIRVDAPGYEVYTRNITVSPNQGLIEDIRLIPQIETPTLGTSLTAAIGSPSSTLEQIPESHHTSVTTEVQPPLIPNTAVPTTRIISDATIPPVVPTSTNTLLSPTNIIVSGCIDLLSEAWHLEGAGPQEASEDNDVANSLVGRSFVRITYDLHGLMALPGDASAIIFDQPVDRDWHYISLSEYGINGFDGTQAVDISLSSFPGLNLSAPVGTLHTRFWYESHYEVDITSIQACA